jgi:hypothetical protein
VEYKIEEVVKIEVGHKIEEVVKIVVNCKIEEEVIGHFGGVLASFGLFCPSLRRFLQAGSTFCGLFSQISFGGFLLPFLRSIFDPFLAFAGFMICLFCGTFWPSKVVFGPFWDPFWDVHLSMILPPSEGGVLHVLVFILGVMVGAVRRPITRPCVGLRCLLWWFSVHSSADFTDWPHLYLKYGFIVVIVPPIAWMVHDTFHPGRHIQ